VLLTSALVVVALLATACDWTQFMGGPTLNGSVTGSTKITPANVGTLTERFRLATGATGASADELSSPVVSNGRIYVVDGQHQRLVVGSTDGVTGCAGTPVVCQPLWTAALPYDAGWTVPTVADGVVYVTTADSSGPGGELDAFDANGVTNCGGTPTVCQPLWTAFAYSIAPPNVVDGKVFVAGVNPGLEVFDASATTGCAGVPKVCQPLWTAPGASFAAPSVADGKVYVVDKSGHVVDVYDEDGVTGCSGTPLVCTPVFTVPLPGSSVSAVDVSSGIGYVGASDGGPAELLAFDATGSQGCTGAPLVCQPLWTAALPGGVGFSTPAVSGGRVYAAGAAYVLAFDAAGQQGCSGSPLVCQPLVSFSAPPGDGYLGISPTVGHVLLVGGQAYDPAGSTGCQPSGGTTTCAPLWSVASGSIATTAEANNLVVVSGMDGAVHVYGLPS
jgi:hypothetical protein